MERLIGLTGWLGGWTEDPERLRLVVSGMLGVAAFMVIVAAYFLLAGVFDPLKRRVQAAGKVADPLPVPVKRDPSGGWLKALGDAVMPKALSKRLKISALLEQAAFRGEGDLNIFYGLKVLSTLLLPLLVIAGVAVTRRSPIADAIPFALAAGALGFLLPDIVLQRMVHRRQERLRRGLPDALDLLVVCSEAGLGLNAGIQRVGQEIAITHPELADELQLVTMQSRAGMDNRSALKGLEERTGLDDIQALVATLTQSMRFGTSIGDTLRIYSAELRDKRLQRAQEKAARISSLMLFPLVTCIMPSFLLVILGPAMIGLAKAFQQMNLG